MICIIGDWEKSRDPFDKAEKQLVQTEKEHQIYGTKEIINPCDVFVAIPGLDAKQKFDLMLHILSYCNIVYMLKGWEYNNDVRMLHDYCACNGYKIVYSKKF